MEDGQNETEICTVMIYDNDFDEIYDLYFRYYSDFD